MENGVHSDVRQRRTVLSRRAFLKFCTLTASLLALPAGTAQLMAAALSRARRIPVTREQPA